MLEHLGTLKHEQAIGELDLKCWKLEQKTLDKQHQREQHEFRMMEMWMRMRMSQNQNQQGMPMATPSSQLPYEGLGLMAELNDAILPPGDPFPQQYANWFCLAWHITLTLVNPRLSYIAYISLIKYCTSLLLHAGNSISLWATLHIAGIAVKQVIHELASELLARRLKPSMCLLQVITVFIPLIQISTTLTIQAYLYKAIPPLFIKVVTFNADDKVMKNNTDVSPHDNDHVVSGINKLDMDLLQGLERPL
jgi:hypothetical protein